ncbi:MAG: hypothetical protein AB4352_27135, partial [Hormoscilla sp.]
PLVVDAIARQLRKTGFLRSPLIFIQGSKRNPVSGAGGGCDRPFDWLKQETGFLKYPLAQC